MSHQQFLSGAPEHHIQVRAMCSGFLPLAYQSLSLSHSCAPARPSPPILSSSANTSGPRSPLSLHSASLKMFQGSHHPFGLSITPPSHQSLTPTPGWNAAHVWLFVRRFVCMFCLSKSMFSKTSISSIQKNDFSDRKSHFSETRTQKRCLKGRIANPLMRPEPLTHPQKHPLFSWKVKWGHKSHFLHN